MDQAELLSLVAEGKEAWNEWADANPSAKVDFSGVNFDSDVAFSGFRFPKYITFTKATFAGSAIFIEATFAGDVDFSQVTFSGSTSFSRASFLGIASFSKTTFSERAFFKAATFSGHTFFSESILKRGAIFTKVKFTDIVSFRKGTFTGPADFIQATFAGTGDFSLTTFSGIASFSKTIFSKSVSFSQATFLGYAFFSDVMFSDTAYFDKTKFMGAASFISIDVRVRMHFEDAEFHSIPDFHAAKNSELIALDTVEFALPKPSRPLCKIIYWATGLCGTDRSTMLSIRQIRGIVTKAHAIDSERDLTILERNAQVGVVWTTLIWPRRDANKTDAISTKANPTPLDRNAQIGAIPELWQASKPLRQWLANFFTTLLEIVLLLAYRWSSDYGRSIKRPLMLLIASPFVWHAIYRKLYICWKLPSSLPLNNETLSALQDIAVSNALPIGTALRPTYIVATGTLFGSSGALPLSFQIFLILQNAVGLILLFLVGLALRNYFRMK